jgi:methyl-accepting chemotaxis protein
LAVTGPRTRARASARGRGDRQARTLRAKPGGVDRDLQDLAGRFLDFVHRATKLPMIVCDERGRIVRAVDRSRVGQEHGGAVRILSGEADEVFVTAEQAAHDPRMKPGCSSVILVDGQRAGTVGLTGALEVSQPVTRIASAVLASWIKERRQQARLRAAAGQVLAGVEAVSARAEAASVEAAQVSALMASASSDAAAKVEHTDAIVRTVHEIAQKSRILSINGSVEAARAGEQGRGFAVVAREMLELAEHARGAAAQVQATLAEVQRAIGVLHGAIERSSALADGQSAALAEVRGVVESLQHAVAELAQGGEGAAGREAGRRLAASAGGRP